MTNHARRRRQLHDWLDNHNVDAMIVNSEANIRYLFGFAGEGMAVVGPRQVISSDRRFENEMAAVDADIEPFFHDRGHLAGIIDALKDMAVTRVCFEAKSTCYSIYEDLRARLSDDIELTPSRKVIEEFRVTKDEAELTAIENAARIMDDAIDSVSDQLQVGCTEKEVALELRKAAIPGGADALAFETICAFGPSAASPHATVTDRRLADGDMVLIDCGAKVDGYCSDLTRTYFVGEPEDRLKTVYEAVYDAQQAAMEAASPGMKCKDLDSVARQIIANRGYEDEFSHGLGHGVGLCVHEMPKVSRRSNDTLKAGMVITIEPGIYINGWGGVRIEDTVAITDSSCRPLTHAQKPRPM